MLTFVQSSFCLKCTVAREVVDMSSRIANNADFFRLFLQTHLPQQKALMSTLSQEQIDLLSEVIFNILNRMPLPDKVQKALKRKKFLVFISLLKHSVSSRRKRLQANQLRFIKVLLEHRDNLLKVVNAS